MRSFAVIGVAAALLGGSVALAGDLESGIPVGKSVPAFQVVKVGGAPGDNVRVGQQLCYR